MEIISLAQILRFAFALLFVLALMGGLALVMRKFGDRHGITPGQKRRLKISEILPLDSKHKAILLKRDNKEHLIILGANSETLIESDIESPQDNGNDTK